MSELHPADDGPTMALRSGGLVRPARFPMQDGPSVDWQTAEEIYAIYSELYGTGQSLERIAQRGGFGWGEVPHMLAQRRERKRISKL